MSLRSFCIYKILYETLCRPILTLQISLFLLVSCKTSENKATQNVFNQEQADKSPEYATPYRPTPPRSFDLIHTDLKIEPDWPTRTIDGLAHLTMTPYFYPQDFLVLDARNFEVNSITISANDQNQDNADTTIWENNNYQLIIDLGQYYNLGDTLTVHIDYVAKPYEDLLPDEEAIDPARGIYFVNASGNIPGRPVQIWTYGQTGYNSSWFPTFDQPNERHTHQIEITVPDSMRTLSNGRLVSSLIDRDGKRTDTWALSQSHPIYTTSLAIGQFSKLTASARRKEFSYFVEPSFEKEVEVIFAETPDMLWFFSDFLDYKYPWPDYKQIAVREFIDRGMEGTSCGFFAEEIQFALAERKEYNHELLLAHEIFHQWFGNLVTCESWSQLTLNEAFASYAEQLWLEYKYGTEQAAFHALNSLDRYLMEAEEENVPLVRYYYDQEEELFDNHTYEKGARVLHALRSYVGDKAFKAALRQYVKENAFQSVEVADLRQSFEHVTGEDLRWFFEQWFFTPGHPELAVVHSYEEDTLMISVRQRQDISVSGLYKLPLLLDLIYEDRIYQYPIVVEDSVHNFKIAISEEPASIIFDADYSLIGVLEHRKSERELLSQYKYGDNFYNRYEACIRILTDSSSTLWPQLFKLAVKDTSQQIRQLSLELLLSQLTNAKLVAYRDLIIKRTADTSPAVRSVALQILYDSQLPADFWEKFLSDSSLLVQGVALDYLLSSSDKADSLFQKYKETNYVDLLIPLSFFVNVSQKPEMTDWYIEKIWSLPSRHRYYLAQSLADYIVSQPTEEKRKAITFFSRFGKVESYHMNRLSAVQALILLEEVSGARELAEDLMEKEVDPRLKTLYSSF